MNVLIDTNVILDAVIGRIPYQVSAEKLFLLAAENKLNAFITASSVTDIYYLIQRHFRNVDQAKQVLGKLFALFPVLEVTGSDCEKALKMPVEDYEDALLAACAKRKKLDLIITRNLKDFSDSPVKAVAPDDFLSSYL
ncbi:PIN domain-containing protein [Desulfosporosinus sp. PR]|uniref:type II toxin-antitoxin system VapC family toxin n=1 Tax=Candidatus Desulfosporosinus nitrosoreducens TaxID=3401928 RepID=UPI0027F8D952|nr:PIN domain-containing protein [Desulfosporosinus sp. PR]MDQ7095560.1 PIN domain-containing protein [Desulfosporosinus sp. PR]